MIFYDLPRYTKKVGFDGNSDGQFILVIEYWISGYEIDPIIKCNFLSQRFLEKEHSNLFSKYICAIIFLLLLIRDRILKMRSLRGKVRNFFRFNCFHLQLSVISNTLSFENYKKILFILIETLIIFDKDWIEFFPFIAFLYFVHSL